MPPFLIYIVNVVNLAEKESPWRMKESLSIECNYLTIKDSFDEMRHNVNTLIERSPVIILLLN